MTDKALITLANDYRFEPGERSKRDCVRSRMQLWCHSGRGTVIVDGETFCMEAGALLIMPWQHEIIYEAARSDPMYVSGIHLMPFCHPPGDITWYQVAHEPSHPLFHVPWLQDRHIDGLERCLYRQLRLNHPLLQLSNFICSVFHRPPLEEQDIRQLSQSLLTEWQRLINSSQQLLPSPLERACRAITSALAKHLSLEDYARIAACSPSTLNRQARQHLGSTLMQWQRSEQMQAAADQLRSSKRSIQSIATSLGFDDPLYFSRNFKQQHGMSPRAYRERFALM